jgi:D-3-phosphoglycerate dehydrogenase
MTEAFRPCVLFSCFYDRPIIAEPLGRLRAMADVREVNRGRNLTEQELLESLPGAHAVIAADEKYPPRLLDAAGDLVLIAREGTGYDGVDVEAATQRGILVTNAPVVHRATANMTIGLLIAMVRKILICDRDVREGRWTQRDRRVCPGLTEMTLGIMGFGLVGREVAARAAALGMKVLVYNRSDVSDEVQRLGARTGSFEEVLAGSDVVSVHIRHSPQTDRMFAKDQFAQMKHGAYFMNMARGGIVDEGALIEALQSRHLAGAAMDVFAEEPPSPDNPLLAMQNVVCAPHVGGETTSTMRQGVDMAVDELCACLDGRRPAHLVNPVAWDHARLHELLSAKRN